jgi:hypothetical protein
MGLRDFLLTNKHLARRTEPDFVKPIGLGQGVFFQSVVTGEDRIFAPVRGPLFFGVAREWIDGECFGIGLESADRSVSSVRQDQLCPGQRDIFGLRADPQGNYSAIALRDTSLVRASADIGHYAVQIHWVLSKPKTYPPRVVRTARFEVRDLPRG